MPFAKVSSMMLVAQKARLTPEIVKDTIKALLDNSVIEQRKELFYSVNPLISPYSSRDGIREILKHWNLRTQEYLHSGTYPSKNSIAGYQVFNLDEGAFEKIRETYRRFYNEICAIVESNNSKGDNSYYFATQIIDFRDLPPFTAAKPKADQAKS